MPQEENGITLHPTEKDQYGLPIPIVTKTDHTNDAAMRRHTARRSGAKGVGSGGRHAGDRHAAPPPATTWAPIA